MMYDVTIDYDIGPYDIARSTMYLSPMPMPMPCVTMTPAGRLSICADVPTSVWGPDTYEVVRRSQYESHIEGHKEERSLMTSLRKRSTKDFIILIAV